MPRQSSVLSSCSLVSFVSCSLLWCMSLHVRFHTAFGLQWFALTQWFPSVHFVFTCRPQCVRRYVYTAFRLLSCFPLVAFICCLQCVSLRLHTVFVCGVLAGVLCPYRLQCVSLRQHTVFVYCGVLAGVLCSYRLQCVSLRQHTALYNALWARSVPFTVRACLCDNPLRSVYCVVFARALCSCHLPSTVVFTTHRVPFASVSFPHVPAPTFKIRNLLRTRNEGRQRKDTPTMGLNARTRNDEPRT